MEAKRAVWLIAVMVCFVFAGSIGVAGTVFVAERNSQRINVYDVNDAVFSLEAVIDYGHDTDGQDPVYGLGPIDLAADEAHDTLFVSFENRSSDGRKTGTAHILLINTRTLEILDTIDVSQADDIGALFFDASRSVLYGVQRNSNLIYEMAWEPAEQHLTIKRIVTLDHMEWACALQVDGDRGYVSEYKYAGTMAYYNDIKEYDISDNWSYVRTIPMGAETTCLGYDSQRGIFYSGAYDYNGSFHHFAKHVMDPNEIIVKDIGHNVTDADADEATGYVFTTGYNAHSSGGLLEMWDTSGWTDDPNSAVAPLDWTAEGLTGPAGVVYLPADTDPNVPEISVTKTDNVTSVVPEDTLTYTITVDPNGFSYGPVQVTDYLPAGVSYNPLISGDPPLVDPNYNPTDHSYTWTVDLTGAPVELTLTVTVDEAAEPLGALVNYVKLTGAGVYGQCYLETPVDQFGGDVIYVDAHRPAGGNGTSWELAYRYLADALDRAARMEGPCEIRTADGIYRPGPGEEDTFAIPDGAAVYGGYAGYGAADPDTRDPYRYRTTLSGYIHTLPVYNSQTGLLEGYQRYYNDTVVTMGDETLLDGFIVTDAMEYGVYGDGVDFTVQNCIITDNEQRGIYASNGDVNVNWCQIKNNGWHGIHHLGESKTIFIENCQLMTNQWYGVFTENSTPEIKNCVVFRNGDDPIFPYPYGLRIYRPTNTPILYNNTILSNRKAGISWVDNHDVAGNPNNLDYPDIQNCILWYNNDGGEQLAGCEFTQYCCVYDPNDPSGIDYSLDAYGNFSGNPVFAYTTEPNNLPDPNNPYHLVWDSPCQDAGNPDDDIYDFGDYDIDGEERVIDDRIDIGADEIYSCNGYNNEDIYNPLDWNADGLVNFGEFNAFQKAWLSRSPYQFGDPNLSDPNETANWNSYCNLVDWGDSEFVIDLEDFTEFVYSDWCWTACWKQSQMDRFENMIAAMMSGGESMMMAVPMSVLSTAEGRSSMSMELSIESAEYYENPYDEMSSLELVSLVQGIYEVIESLDLCLAAGDENAEDFLEAKEFLESVLSDIAASRE